MENEGASRVVDTVIKYSHDLGYAKGYFKGLCKGFAGAVVVIGVGKTAYEYYKKKHEDKKFI